MMKTFLLPLCLLLSASLVLLLSSCNGLFLSEEEKASDSALAFASAYFNHDYVQSSKYATDDSQPWLRLAATNIRQTDIDQQNELEKDAEVSLLHLDLSGKTQAFARIMVSDFLLLDSIEGQARHVDEATFTLTLVQDNSHWKVKMAGPLRSEMPYPD